jgi:methylmalonyl-CoA/ethylmalonyl-CoA epimerase
MDEFPIHHFGVAVRDLQDGIASFEKLMGYKLQSGPFDDPIQNVSVCFLARTANEPALELVAPLSANSPVDATLRKGGGIYHLCYEVPDIRSAIQQLTDAGAILLSGPDPAVAFEMREIAWLMTEAFLLVELLQSPQQP